MNRPWIMPDQLIDFSEHKSVKEKPTVRMLAMICLAESKIISYCKHDFSDENIYPIIPESVINATLILADALCFNDNLKTSGLLKSETYDDYSYTVDVKEISTDFDVLGIKSLLKPYVQPDDGNLFLRIGVV